MPTVPDHRRTLVAVFEIADARAIVLQLVNPAVAVRPPRGKRRLARDDKAGRLEALRPTQRSGVRHRLTHRQL